MDSEREFRLRQIAAGHKRVAGTFIKGTLLLIAFGVVAIMILRKLPV